MKKFTKAVSLVLMLAMLAMLVAFAEPLTVSAASKPVRKDYYMFCKETKNAKEYSAAGGGRVELGINQKNYLVIVDRMEKAVTKNIKFKSSKGSVVSVSSKGVVTAKKKGEATITGYVKGKEVSSIRFEVIDSSVGDFAFLDATVDYSKKPENLASPKYIRGFNPKAKYTITVEEKTMTIKKNKVVKINLKDKNDNKVHVTFKMKYNGKTKTLGTVQFELMDGPEAG